MSRVPSRPLAVARRDAARASLAYHFAATDVPGVFARHASVQFDPLAPLGCNHDLVLAARVPGYRIGEWTGHVYERRAAYDGWDKQASLVEVTGQPARRAFHGWFGDRWRRDVLEIYPRETAAVLRELRDRGPLDVSEVALDVRVQAWQGSWYGPRLAKRILRALWHTGRVSTHHRRLGRHVYDLTERVVPSEILNMPTPDEDESVRTLVLDRHRATGLLRPTAPAEVWSLPVPARVRHAALAELVAAGELHPVKVDGRLHHVTATWLEALESGAEGAPGAHFVAPLDPVVWDRPGLAFLHGFDYRWEVYKPEAQREWGYYVLPVVYRGRFVARFDAVRDTSGRRPVWRMRRWWWQAGAEDGLAAGREGRSGFLAALEEAASRFAHYLGVSRFASRGGVPREVASALRRGAAEAIRARHPFSP